MNDIEKLRVELADYSVRSFNRQMVSGAGGNLSVRVPGTDTVLITPTGISLGEVKPEQNILVDMDGNIIDSPMGLKGSKETSFHLGAYQLRPDIGAISHVHPLYATAYSNLGIDLPLVTVSSRVGLKHVPCVDCYLPGSKELREVVCDGIRSYPDSNALLMKEHGILAMGVNLTQAYNIADLVEGTAKIAYVTQSIAH
jgi:L-fuculose-phosphate aldolase